MYSYKQIAERIEAIIAEYKYETSTPDLYDPIKYTISQSGKRLRPALSALSCNIYSDRLDGVWSAAIAIEMFHNFTLLHDDIMDNSALRRNMPTVHVKWGANAAILSGDAMLIESYKLLSQSPKELLPEILEVFNTVARGVCEGQQLDMAFEQTESVTLPEYLNMIGLKTAVLLEGAMRIGALIGGATTEQASQLGKYGYTIGLAFQIQDDLLDLYGNQESFGKPIGGDVIEGKKCYLLLSALEKANSEQRSEIERLIADKEISSDQKVAQVKAIYDSLEIKATAERAVEECFAKADGILASMALPQERLKELVEFVSKLKNREK